MVLTWTDLVVREGYEGLPVAQWTWEECMTWLIAEGGHSCADDFLLPEEAREEVQFMMKQLGITHE